MDQTEVGVGGWLAGGQEQVAGFWITQNPVTDSGRGKQFRPGLKQDHNPPILMVFTFFSIATTPSLRIQQQPTPIYIQTTIPVISNQARRTNPAKLEIDQKRNKKLQYNYQNKANSKHNHSTTSKVMNNINQIKKIRK